MFVFSHAMLVVQAMMVTMITTVLCASGCVCHSSTYYQHNRRIDLSYQFSILSPTVAVPFEEFMHHCDKETDVIVFETDLIWDIIMACNSNAGLILEEALNNDHPRRRALCLRREERGMSFENKSIVQLPICPIRFLLVFGQRSPCRVSPPFKFTTMNLIDDTRAEFGL